MVNYAKYINRDDNKGLEKAIYYSFVQKYCNHPEVKHHLQVVDKNNNIAENLRKV